MVCIYYRQVFVHKHREATMISGWKRAAIHWQAGHVYMPERQEYGGGV